VAQLNPVVGDIDGNLAKIADTLSFRRKDAPDLVIFPELFLAGYPPRDLLEKKWFIEKTEKAIKEILKISTQHPHTGILVGAPLPTGKNGGRGLYNAALLIDRGRELFRQSKSLLPTYDVFDEARYFDPAADTHVVPFRDEILGLSVCEDAWNDPELWPRQIYPSDPIAALARKGATVFINISASPFSIGKEAVRFRIIQNYARKFGIPFVFVNQVGSNDELIFDGRSMCVDKNGNPIEIFPSFREHVQTVETGVSETPRLYRPQDEVESVYEALVLGIRDYMGKCGVAKAVIGLSGGIDSALTCCLAREAIGRDNILGIAMPGPYSSPESLDDAEKLTGTLGIEFRTIPITPLYEAYLHSLKGHLKSDGEVDVTLENIQARIRGNILMAFSNEYGSLVLSTGNKSELAVGYCTLYGDMAGGLAVISDVPKTLVYRLSRHINRKEEIIPASIIEKPPSAELKPDQRDQDTLPPYDILDRILHLYVREGRSLDEIVGEGIERETAVWVIRAVNRNEYKRRQAAPGLKVTSKAFGAGRRMPIAAKYDI
jgi:NAD+ synthase (glutamine-hydrolysing)